MNRNVLILLLVVLLNFSCGEEKKDNDKPIQQVSKQEDNYLVEVDEEPTPVGGIKEIAQRIKYPETAKNEGIQGRVFIRAYIDEEGNVISAEVLRSVRSDLDEAALKAIKETKFQPGMKDGKPVKVQVSIPVVFKLE